MDRRLAPAADCVTKRGFLLGKFMPPHAGHIALIEAARQLVDRLTVLVCWLPGDPIDGRLRFDWMRELFPDCRVVGHGEPAPQDPSAEPDFWPAWQGIVRGAHPEPIDYLFAGEAYGAELARHVGGLFVPLGGRVLGMDDRVASVSGHAIRSDPAAHWHVLPEVVRRFYRKHICLHGIESTGKSVLAARLAVTHDTAWVGEYGRSHCEAHTGDLSRNDLVLIGAAQAAMIEAARRWAGPHLIIDTDALMTAAWCEMLLGEVPAMLLTFPRADLYLLMEPDLPWVDDGTRYFHCAEDRARFAEITERILVSTDAPFVRISGEGDERERQAHAAIRALS
jgi:NadR type nicotinamide-nucleotide adenylyltransferase